MLRRSPLKAKRETPRRNEGRVTHGRAKPKEAAAPTAEEKRHLARVAALGCLICAAPAECHHVTAKVTGGRIARSHQRVAPLCEAHHRNGPDAVHQLGHCGFFLRYGVDLHAQATRLWAEREGASRVTRGEPNG